MVRRLRELIVQLLKSGLTPEKIAMSIALGLAIGVIPVLGTTTILCAAVALLLGLNLPLIQSVNYLVYPLQFALLIPFMRLGAWLFGAPGLELSPAYVASLVTTDPRAAISTLWIVTLQAVVAWLVCAIVVTIVLYPVLVPLLRRVAPRGAAA